MAFKRSAVRPRLPPPEDCNQLAKAEKNDILTKLNKKIVFVENKEPFGDGHSSEKIVSIIKKYFSEV